jgi:hypothetical protein
MHSSTRRVRTRGPCARPVIANAIPGFPANTRFLEPARTPGAVCLPACLSASRWLVSVGWLVLLFIRWRCPPHSLIPPRPSLPSRPPSTHLRRLLPNPQPSRPPSLNPHLPLISPQGAPSFPNRPLPPPSPSQVNLKWVFCSVLRGCLSLLVMVLVFSFPKKKYSDTCKPHLHMGRTRVTLTQRSTKNSDCE